MKVVFKKGKACFLFIYSYVAVESSPGGLLFSPSQWGF